jgi:hypothetical protein
VYKDWTSYSSKAPVEQANQNLQRGTANGEDILDEEQASRERYICKGAKGKGDSGKGKADDGEILKVPSVGLVSVRHRSG